MFDFKSFIGWFLAILGIFIPIYVNLKKEIIDFESETIKTTKDKIKSVHRKQLLTSITVFTIICILIALFFSFMPLFKDINFIDSIFTKTLPFKDGFFENENFTFSFITEIILATLFVGFLELMIFFTYAPLDVSEYIVYMIMFIVTFIVSAYIFIWCSYFASLFMTVHITQHFKLLSLVINLSIFNGLTRISGIIFDKINGF